MCTYLEYYNENYASKIQAIDLFLKADHENGFTLESISTLLNITMEEIETLMKTFQIQQIDAVSFFVLLQNGSSSICKLFSRELHRKMPYFYSFYDISYIYQIPYEHVVEGAKSADLNHITSQNIHLLFENIHMAS
ncbi:MAG: hypothetical protein H7X94_07525 [Vallitaleaceae bacterium]|nr:hypothetical protein [Vallitaleaceae bacterium]